MTLENFFIKGIIYSIGVYTVRDILNTPEGFMPIVIFMVCIIIGTNIGNDD